MKVETHDDSMRMVLARVRRRWGPLLTFSAAFSLLEAAVLAPTAAGVLRLALQSWGRCSVGNFEIVAFFLSPVGLAGLAVLTALQLTTLSLRLAGVMGVLSGDGPGVWHAFDSVKRLPALLKVDLLQAVLLLLLAAPFGAAGAFAYAKLWGPHDLNRLVVERPAAFWEGVAAVGAIGVLYAAAAGWLYLRWMFAVPAVLFEDVRAPWTALRSSGRRTSGRIGRLAVVVLGAGAGFLAASAALTWLLHTINGLVLDQVGPSPKLAVAATAALLAVDGALLAGFSAAAAAIFAALIMASYKQAGGVIRETVVDEPRARWWTTAAVALSAGSLALSALAAKELIGDARVSERVEVTAHRAGAFDGPENTVAALRIAARQGAEWAEIDVQSTADDQLVIVHDDDLLRIAGSPLRIVDSTLEQLRAIDLGTPFDPGFAGERIATLDEFLQAAASASIGLNIELKAKNDAGAVALVAPVLEAVRKADALGRVRICGQSYPALQAVRRLEPGLELGFITGAVIGDPTRLDVDFLMVETRLATRDLVDRARSRDMPVQAWTVNVVDRVASLVDDGVAGIITDDVRGVLARLAEINALDPLERLLLRVRHGLTRR
ncbi:glycerophosphodiester phosphodiesterase [Planctomyces sp. SH-PL62]|uniref:glycerophosphodiester phosphodiesterase n=1 Tax=Planctomyces sp. SH-PL62 TaxID=1636152 RepID=UPI00078E833F|nr:glycerophosphodiester phosphodiesterase family protein [Planctomyces sp. SH-PL62]AMV35792.1 Glycerophosphoryl diester phosphodiesterase [Planctomyces sp. SH-PL62]